MAGQLTIDTLKASSGVLATQNGMTGIAKAWINFQGAASPTIRASFNVSSITRNAAGDYTLNFTTAMPNANYTISGAASLTGTAGDTAFWVCAPQGTISTTQVRINTVYTYQNLNDCAYTSVQIFGA